MGFIGDVVNQGYKPANVFSFSFHKRNKDGSLADSTLEYFFTVGASSYSENFKFRINHEPTFNGGTILTDYGIGNGVINIDGEFHIYYSARPATTSSFAGSFENPLADSIYNRSGVASKVESTIDNFNSLDPRDRDKRSGIVEFFDFCGLFFFSRDPLTGYESPDTQAAEILSRFNTKDRKFSYDKWGIVFNDYDRHRFVEIFIPSDGFTIKRSIQDTNTYQYSLQMITLRTWETNFRSIAVKEFPNMFSRLTALINDIKNLIQTPLILTGTLLNVVNFMNSAIVQCRSVVDTFNNMRDQFDADGKLIGRTFQSTVDEIKASFGIRPKKNPLDADNLDKSREDFLSAVSSAQNKFGAEVAKAISKLEALINAMQGAVAPMPPAGDDTTNPADVGLILDPVWGWGIAILDALVDAQAQLIYAQVDDSYGIYHPNPGDTWDTIAENELGDPSLATALAAYNRQDISKRIIANNAIKIPYGKRTYIYAKLPEGISNKILELGLIGEDLALTSDRDFKIAANGDFEVTQGDVTLLNNIVDLISTPVGSFIVDPTLGNPIPIGELRSEIDRQGYLQKLLTQITNDPRVLTVRVMSEETDGDKLTWIIEIKSASGGSYFIRV